LIVIGAVAPAKGDLLVEQSKESMIGDGEAMGVAA
jgi:hypothetical protein